MKSISYKIFGAVSILCLLAVSSCKKSDDSGLKLGNSTLTMTLDGKPWKSIMSTMVTLAPEETEEDYYVVAIVGSQTKFDNIEELDETEGLQLWLAIPKGKFKNPSGTYKFADMEDVTPENPAHALFIGTTNEKLRMYATIGNEGSLGSLTINKFKTGKQSFLGTQIGDHEGYTHLSGTFSMTLTEVLTEEGAEPKIIKITNGKFDVNSGLNLGGLFGQYSELKERIQLK